MIIVTVRKNVRNGLVIDVDNEKYAYVLA